MIVTYEDRISCSLEVAWQTREQALTSQNYKSNQRLHPNAFVVERESRFAFDFVSKCKVGQPTLKYTFYDLGSQSQIQDIKADPIEFCVYSRAHPLASNKPQQGDFVDSVVGLIPTFSYPTNFPYAHNGLWVAPTPCLPTGDECTHRSYRDARDFVVLASGNFGLDSWMLSYPSESRYRASSRSFAKLILNTNPLSNELSKLCRV